VRVPVGLDVGAESPEEIALAIMAEVLAVLRRKTGRPLREVRGAQIQHVLGQALPQLASVS
jgi:xanthine dehydrogenase accessory factor